MFSKKFILDALERAGSTYVQALVGFLIANAVAINVGTIQSAALAAIPAALSVLKSAIASQFGNSDSASLLPGAPLVDGQKFHWVDFPNTFEIANPDGSIAWGGKFADGSWDAVDPDDLHDTDAGGE